MPDVASWLAEFGLEKYAKDFDGVEIDFETLPELTEKDLVELGSPIVPKRKVWAVIQRLSGGLKEQNPLGWNTLDRLVRLKTPIICMELARTQFCTRRERCCRGAGRATLLLLRDERDDQRPTSATRRAFRTGVLA
ncbi:SAM domain-containing protein [Ruegeria conchae]|uniref:SAM (Sterile alpha motif) domain-containing protein n=1 Tax=Ruegeria conchae TaxID=981384 RepID=A0A497ZJJ9_9RHOB|nr:SAM (Sterile alpha motif) domain-containing protein [Ruegeria conchae]